MRTINDVKKVLKAFQPRADVVAITIDIDSIRTHHEHKASKQQLKLLSEFVTAMGMRVRAINITH